MIRTKLPEETTLGRSLLPKNSDNTKDILEFIITNKSKPYFTYEYKYNNSNIPVFITGVNTENALPFIKFPVVLRTNNINYIVSNITGSTKSDLTNSIMKSKRNDNVDFEVVRNITIFQTLEDKDMNSLMSITAQLATIWITRTLRNQLRLDLYSEGDVEGAVFNYFIKCYLPEIKTETVKIKMMNFLSLHYKNNNGNCDRVLELLKEVPANTTMQEYIRAACPDHPILSKIEDKAILAMIGNNWFSGVDNSNIQVFLSIENFHTMCGILYHSANTVSGSKSILGRLLKDNKRISKLDQFIDTVSGLMKDNSIM